MWVSAILVLVPYVYAVDFDCNLVQDGGKTLKGQLVSWSYGVFTVQDIYLAVDHLFNACCRGDGWWQLGSETCNAYTTPVWPKSMYLFDQLIAIWFEKLTSLRGDQPLFEGMDWSDYDTSANQRYDIISQEMIKYEGVLPEVLSQQFLDMWKIDVIAPASLASSCVYDLPVDIWLAGKHYNVCDMTNCLMNQTYIRSPLTKQWVFNQSTNKDYLNCRNQATDLIIKHLQQTQAVITAKSLAYQHNNRVNYVSELVDADIMPKIIETINGVTSDLSMVMQTTHPRAVQCFGNS